MKERPILFNAEMVNAIISGRKTQTRRVVQNVRPDNCLTLTKSTKKKSGTHTHVLDAPNYGICPLGQPGDQLWVRETMLPAPLEVQSTPPRETLWNIAYRDGQQLERLAPAAYNPTIYNYERWTPSIHMPRWASRIQLKITNVGVQRLQDISSGDSVREGICQLPASGRYCINPGDQYFGGASHSAQEVFYWLWDSIYMADSKRSWQANPWVWVIEFELIDNSGAKK